MPFFLELIQPSVVFFHGFILYFLNLFLGGHRFDYGGLLFLFLGATNPGLFFDSDLEQRGSLPELSPDEPNGFQLIPARPGSGATAPSGLMESFIGPGGPMFQVGPPV